VCARRAAVCLPRATRVTLLASRDTCSRVDLGTLEIAQVIRVLDEPKPTSSATFLSSFYIMGQDVEL
jgi:hypothetical protein